MAGLGRRPHTAKVLLASPPASSGNCLIPAPGNNNAGHLQQVCKVLLLLTWKSRSRHNFKASLFPKPVEGIFKPISIACLMCWDVVSQQRQEGAQPRKLRQGLPTMKRQQQLHQVREARCVVLFSPERQLL